MRIGIIGSGVVGQTLGIKLSSLGHDVTIGTRDPSKTGEKKGMGASLDDWVAATGGKGKVASFAGAATHGELIINATHGLISVDALKQAGAENLAGKVVIDTANELDFSNGMPPVCLAKDAPSLAERIQEAFPAAKVVKAFNTMSAPVMVNPRGVGGGDHTFPIAGEDPAAKATVTELLKTFGWTDIWDAGGVRAARGMEMLMPFWLGNFMKLGTPMFNLKIVR